MRRKGDPMAWFDLAIEQLHSHGQHHVAIRVLIGRRNRARGTKMRRSLSMKIHHERRRLLQAGVDQGAVDKLIEFWDTRARCPRCGRVIG